MSLVAAIRDMLAKGLSIEQALEAAELVESREEARRVKKKVQARAKAKAEAEAEEAAEEARRAKHAERSRRYRERVKGVTPRDAHVTPRDASCASPPPKKETFPPIPPLLEKTTTPLSLADARLVDESVDVAVTIEKTKKNNEALKAFGEEWNRLAASLALPSIDEIKPGSLRERQALARLREMTPDGVQGLMTRIRGSPYLRGEVNGFRVSFDWIIKPSNYQKIMEGNYEVRKAAPLNGRGRPARFL